MRAKTLFATHYHELNEMTNSMHRIKNFNVSVKEVNNKILFMRKLVAGGSEHSFGIHVAKMAGMPKKVVDRANQLLVELESQRDKSDNKNKDLKVKKQESGNKNDNGFKPSTATSHSSSENMQLSFFQLNDPVLENIKEELQRTDINTLTPVEALMKLNEIKKMIGG